MKIGICALGPDLDSEISPVFGRAPYFLIIDEETEQFRAISNPGFQAGRGAGVGASQTLVSQGIKALICGNLGPNAFSILETAGVKIYPGIFGLKIKEVLNRFKKGQLKESEGPSTPGHFGFGGGRGFGGGFGPGPKRHRHRRRGRY